MYNVSTRSTTNIVAKTRGRHPQPDTKQPQKIVENDHRCGVVHPLENMTSPPLVFKKSPIKTSPSLLPQPQITQNQEEMIKYVQLSWTQVMQEYESSQRQGNSKVVYYEPRSTTSSTSSDFKPFELEEWFIQRIVDLDPSIDA